VNTARASFAAGSPAELDLSIFGGPKDFPVLTEDDAEGPADQLLCVICRDTLKDKPKKALVPCGHTFCSGCVDRVKASGDSYSLAKCPSCRERIKATIKIFF
jgi:Zinc finger, C3HC4 type (RING finger)